jgi:hypothetical protein
MRINLVIVRHHSKRAYPMTKEATSLSTLCRIALGKLLLPESEYEKLYEKRRARLSSIEVSSEGLADSLSRAAALTQQSHSEAAELLSTMEFIESRFPSTIGEKLGLLSQLSQQAETKVRINISEEVLAGVREKERKANEFLVWLLSDKHKGKAGGAELTVGEMLRERYKDEREFDLQLIEEMVSMRLRMLESIQLQLNVLVPMYDLLKIFRGILYVGVFSVAGGELDRKNTVDQLVGLAQELAGTFLPGLGLVVSLAKLISAWLELDISPEQLKNADFVERYLQTYTGLLTEWSVRARVFNDCALSSARVVLKK